MLVCIIRNEPEATERFPENESGTASARLNLLSLVTMVRFNVTSATSLNVTTAT